MEIENESILEAAIEPHPNICRYFCRFEDRIPQEFYEHLPSAVKEELSHDPARNSFVWIVLEHNSESLGTFLTNTMQNTALPWCIVHKYSKDICAALVHLFVNHDVIHFGLQLDTFAVSRNKEQLILMDLWCATKRKLFRRNEVTQFCAGNERHIAPDILNEISQHFQEAESSDLEPFLTSCETQPSFGLGCLLLELAMCGRQSLSGYPKIFYDADGLIPLTQREESAFLVKSADCPPEFCNLICGLLHFDPAKRIQLLGAYRILEHLGPPNPSTLLSFYSHIVVPTDSGSLTMKAMHQLHSGISTVECVSTVREALQITPSFAPALLLLHYIYSASIITPVQLEKDEKKGIAEVLTGRASLQITSVELLRAIDRQHGGTLPELLLLALWMRHICPSQYNHKQKPLQVKLQTMSQQQPFSPSIVMKLLMEFCSTNWYEQMWNDKISACSYGWNPRNAMMMKALLQWELGNITSAIDLVLQATLHFNWEHRGDEVDKYKQEYLPGLLFLYGLTCVTQNREQFALHYIPADLYPTFSRATSPRFSLLRKFCRGVLSFHDKNKQKTESTLEEWNDLLYTIAAKVVNIQIVKYTPMADSPTQYLLDDMDQRDIVRGGWCGSDTSTDLAEDIIVTRLSVLEEVSNSNNNSFQSWTCMFFVALWMTICLRKCGSALLTYLVNRASCVITSHNMSTEQAAPQQPPPRFKPACMTILGLCFTHGCGGVHKNASKALSLLESAARDGDSAAMYNLGMYYYDENSEFTRDAHKAAELYRRGSDCGDPQATHMLGVLFDVGEGGFIQDTSKAIPLWQRAAEAGDADAMYNLAVCYNSGEGIEKDCIKAVSLYQRAANGGNTAAMNNLGVCYENGEGVPEDTGTAMMYYERGAEEGDASAMFNLALCYEEGTGGVVDVVKALKFLQLAADAGSTGAMFSLGEHYEHGEGVEPDMKKAVSLWQQAADGGCPNSMYSLGVLHHRGDGGLCRDIRTAVAFYRLAANSNHTKAQEELDSFRRPLWG
ncbi:sel1 repeat family protein [Pelomyxa schiedti]|nr:sel1 repeat family protein [Pelomyxa schiedti]